MSGVAIGGEGPALSLWKGWIYPTRVDPLEIAREVAEKHGLPLSDLRTYRTNRWKISHPRQELMWRLRRELRPNGAHRFSCPWIARFMGLKDHTTILFGAAAHQDRIDKGLL